MATAETYSRDDSVNADEIMQKLYEMFGSAFEYHVIHSIAQKCNYNIEVTSNELLERLETSTNSKVRDPMVDNTAECITAPDIGAQTNRDSVRLYSGVIGSNQNNDDADVVIESETINYTAFAQNSPFNHISVRSKTQSKKEREFERIVQHVRQGAKILILLRGLPGSGKSFLARQIVDRTVGHKDYSTFILSSDDYFFNKRTKRYEYDVYKLQNAHESNQQRAYKQMSTGVSPVIIDNTNTQMWEMKSYAMIAANFGYIVEILEPFTPWVFDERQLASRNSHGVPKSKIRDMLMRYEKHITPASLFQTYNLSYLNQVPPVLRDFPPVYHNPPKLEQATRKNVNNPRKQSPSKVTDLIGFEEKTINHNGIRSLDNADGFKPTSSLMDSILTDTNTTADEILLPSIYGLSNISLNSQPEVKKICVSPNESPSKSRNDEIHGKVQQIKNAKEIYPSLNLASWGLPDNAISSWEFWDVVTPVNNSKANSPEIGHAEEFDEIIEKSHSATNTSSHDFALLTKKDLSNEEIRILETVSRDINAGFKMTPPSSPSKKALLHKSSMTNEDHMVEDCENETEQLESLKSLFPTIPFDYIRDIYDKCNKSINWVVDLLLDDNKELLPTLNSKNISTSPTRRVSWQNLPESSLKSENTPPSEIASSCYTDIERHIKKSIEINKDLYSDHVLKIKNARQKSTASSFDVTSTRAGEVIAINSDIDINDFEPDINFPTEDFDEDQTVEINLGDVCVTQLETLFGFPETFPKGFQPVVQIPYELAEQLHAFYIQSALLQMEAQNTVLDMIVKEDEELAKKLQMQDDIIEEADSGRRTPDLNEIIKEEVANKAYRREMEEWKKLTPDTLAAKLTIQKLCNSFPSVSKSLLMEILHAHNNSYEQTVEVLLASTDRDSIYDPHEDIRVPPIPDAVLNEMKLANEEKLATETVDDVSKTAIEYRDEANDYYGKHNECMQKAQRAFQSRQYAVAQFYSDLAKSYTRLYEQTNGLAATAFLQEHSEKLQNFQTLDLHYLYVKEALPALDIFLDRNINLLRGTNKKKETLFIITGRGKRSPGKSRLRPAVIQHLRKRDIKYSLLNPGLLNVNIHPHSVLTHNLQQ
ncbi:hypothetical protein PPYR_10488 [Photinus pyralis]|uniref:Smr domain-containing protein n=1 Tax=Photinus pyralis TaxID=7054 RepID=A0A1Y1MN01_PHOPY|nr:NEDD4-binding protein 2 [Photinus pyralis]XP_031346207.1 NEDD4-binding protein 2 [Photinus pyralis]KAB0796427.1 hypothetical protein PPYR_10488 [Photinus pyralis]